MIDLYLRAGNAGAMANAVPFLREDGEWLAAGEGFVLDVLNHIELVPPVYTRFGVQRFAAVMDNGFHLNLRCTEEIAAMVPESVRVYPATPRRLWA